MDAATQVAVEREELREAAEAVFQKAQDGRRAVLDLRAAYERLMAVLSAPEAKAAAERTLGASLDRVAQALGVLAVLVALVGCSPAIEPTAACKTTAGAYVFVQDRGVYDGGTFGCHQVQQAEDIARAYLADAGAMEPGAFDYVSRHATVYIYDGHFDSPCGDLGEWGCSYGLPDQVVGVTIQMSHGGAVWAHEILHVQGTLQWDLPWANRDHTGWSDRGWFLASNLAAEATAQAYYDEGI